jgi:hypothetical protein
VAREACPAAPPMKPAGQVEVQAPWPGRPVNEAGEQGRQDSGAVCPTSGFAVPGAHAVQLGEAGAVEKEPAAHAAQAAGDVARREGWNVPAGQDSQASNCDTFPCRTPKVPRGQGVSTPPGQKEPTGHTEQVVAPSEE